MEDQGVQDVLIAEDDRDDYEILEDVINSLELKIVVSRAENGDLLMKLIHEKIPDLLFLDLVLPCKDGKACIKEIRGDKKFDGLPIIVYSSLKDLESIDFCFRSGTNLYLVKPNSYTSIVEAVQRIFSVDWKKLSYYPTRSDFVLNPDC